MKLEMEKQKENRIPPLLLTTLGYNSLEELINDLLSFKKANIQLYDKILTNIQFNSFSSNFRNIQLFTTKECAKEFIAQHCLKERISLPLKLIEILIRELSNTSLASLGKSVLNLQKETNDFENAQNNGLFTTEELNTIEYVSVFNKVFNLKLGDFVLKGENEVLNEESCFISLIGCLYLLQGFDCCKKLLKQLRKEYKSLNPTQQPVLKKFKSTFDSEEPFQLGSTSNISVLIDTSRRKLNMEPIFSVLAEYGPPHLKVFCFGVSLGGILIAKTQGKSKKKAKEKVAFIVLRELLNIPNLTSDVEKTIFLENLAKKLQPSTTKNVKEEVLTIKEEPSVINLIETEQD